MKLIYTTILTVGLALGATPNMKAVSENAAGAQKIATEIHTMLKSKTVDMTLVAGKVDILHDYAVKMHDEMASADRSNPEVAKIQDATNILKTLTENKKMLAGKATAKDRGSLRMTASNMITRADMILKLAAKNGG